MHRNLKQQVSKRDCDYIEGLLPDLVSHSEESPDEVFQQLIELAAGPLVVDKLGSIDVPETVLEQQYPDLVLMDTR